MKIYLNRSSRIYFKVHQTILSIFPAQCPGIGSGRSRWIFTLEIKENEITVPNILLFCSVIKISELAIIRCTIIMNLYNRNYYIIWFMCVCVCVCACVCLAMCVAVYVLFVECMFVGAQASVHLFVCTGQTSP